MRANTGSRIPFSESGCCADRRFGLAMSNLKQKVAKGAVWALLEKFSTQFVQFFVTLVLARLLTPNDYGTVALLTIFVDLSWVLVDCGLGTALVQKKDATDLDFNSAFYSSLCLSVCFYGGLFCIAPTVATFYRISNLTSLMRVLALQIIFNSMSSVQNAELSRKFLFNLSFRIGVIQCLVHAVSGVVLAYLGYGAWAIVWSVVLTSAAGFVLRWFIIRWRPALTFSVTSAKALFRFGWKLLVSALLERGYQSLSGLIIGKIYMKADLAFMQKGRQLPSLGMDAVNNTLLRVSFPALAQMQDDPAKMRDAMRRMIQLSTFLSFPLMVGLAVCARPVVLLLLGEQWLPAVPYVRIYCFSFALWPFHTINLQAINAIGRSDVFLKLEIIKKVVGIIMMLASIRYGVLFFVAISAFVVGPLGVIINSWPNRKLLGYSVLMQIFDILPLIGMTVLMGSAVCVVESYARIYSSMPYLVGFLVLEVMVGVLTYGALSFLFKPAAFRECRTLIARRFAR